MSIEHRNRIEELERRVAALEAALEDRTPDEERPCDESFAVNVVGVDKPPRLTLKARK